MTFLVGTEDEFNKNLAQKLGIELIKTETRMFSDKEICPKTFVSEKRLKGQHVIYCSKKTPDENPQNYFMNFLLETARLKKAGAKVTAIMPYMVYARQDKNFIKKGAFEACSIETIIKALAPYVSKIITVNAHFKREQGVYKKYARPIHVIDGFNVFNDEFKDMENCIVIAPDKGMKKRAKQLSKEYGCDFDYAIKHRDKLTNKTWFEDKKFKLEDKTVIIPDDMISSGGTLIQLIEHLTQYNPKQIYAIAVHGAFAKGAYEKLAGKCERVLFTDSLENDKATHSIVDLLADYIKCNKLVYKS